MRRHDFRLLSARPDPTGTMQDAGSFCRRHSLAKRETDINPTETLKIATSLCALMVAMPAQAQEEQGQQDDVQVLSSWNYDPLYAEGWNVENMFDMTEVVDANGEDIGDIENVIFSNDGEVLGIIAQVGGFWDILDTKAYPFASGRPTSSAMKACRRAVFM